MTIIRETCPGVSGVVDVSTSVDVVVGIGLVVPTVVGVAVVVPAAVAMQSIRYCAPYPRVVLPRGHFFWIEA
jgi:hypothetical protein